MFGLLVVSKLSQKTRTAKENEKFILDKPTRRSDGGGSGELLLQQLVATGLRGF